MKTLRLPLASILMLSALWTAACDDDGDGDDGATTTTSTIAPVTTTSSTTTTTIRTTTTTRDIPISPICGIVWSVTNDVSLGALQFETVYTAARGVMRGSGDQVQCVNSTSAIASFNDDDASDTLSAGFISINGLDAPLALMECTLDLDIGVGVEPTPDDFVVTVIDATDPLLNPVTAEVAVTGIACSPIGTTVTTSSTTTSSTTTPTVVGGSFTVGLSLDDAVNVGALQLTVSYAPAPGSFDGSGDTVACFDRTGSLSSFNDQEGTETLAAGFISLAGFTGPRLLAECNFTSDGGDPAPGDFTVAVVDAAAPDLTPIVPTPTVSVSVTPR